MRILIVIENYLPHIGGVETVFKNLSEGLVKKGHDVSLVTHQLKGAKRFEVINGVKVHRVPCFGSRYLFSFLSIPKVVKMARRADIIHTTTFNGAFPSWLASKITGKPVIITVHEVWITLWQKLGGMNFFSAGLHEIFERLIYTLHFNRYVGVSKSTLRQLAKIGKGGKSVCVYNGFDYGFFNPERYDGSRIRKKLGMEKDFVIFAYGRPGYSKGFEYLINAAPAVSRKIKNARFVLILSRDKAYRKRHEYMADLAEKSGAGDRITIIEPVPFKELPNYIKAADCIVIPSLTEGKPVVATDTTSIPEVIYGRYVLVEPKSSKAIAEGIEKIYNRKWQTSPKKDFSVEKNINGYLKVYGEVLGK